MKGIQIKSWLTGAVIFDSKESTTLLEAVNAAVASGADLSGADLSRADLSRADLSGADLSGADLSRADLSRADLSGADLSRADLSGADLSRADLSGADLSGADLSGADLSECKEAPLILARTQIVPQVGAFEGFKKLSDGVICHIQIPADAKRLGGLLGRKCRASAALVLEGEGVSSHDTSFKYTVGKVVKPKETFNDDIREECASGIHFFLTREEAVAYEG